ncbi:26060_t:CDS:2 [Dentiscutata erythropus]|uniref:26060_t:CDS:1 n=1 Tax=Dentiscutata erythropus TaxID=1348616 RepID=A0A9N9A877_9GLOM|nr:26060_t:CDS:2 [Dentiscutata erythropus]
MFRIRDSRKIEKKAAKPLASHHDVLTSGPGDVQTEIIYHLGNSGVNSM